MKTLIKINFLAFTAIVFCNLAQAQQKASDKSFNTVLNEVKQKQAIRSKMIQQMRQTTPIHGSQNNPAVQPSNTNGGAASAQQTTTTTQQATITTSSSQPIKIPARSKKQ